MFFGNDSQGLQSKIQICSFRIFIKTLRPSNNEGDLHRYKHLNSK